MRTRTVYVQVSYDLHLSVYIHSTALQMYLAVTNCELNLWRLRCHGWRVSVTVHSTCTPQKQHSAATFEAVYLSRSMTEVKTNWSQPIARQWYDENQHLYCCHPICEEWPMVLNIIKLFFHGLSVGYRTFHWTSGKQNIRYMKMEQTAFAHSNEHTLG